MPAAAEAVEEYGDDDHEADDDFLEVVGPAHLLRAVAQDGHDEGAYDGAEDRAGAAVQARAADDDRGDDVELEPDGDGRVPEAQPRELEDPREAEEAARKDEDEDLEPRPCGTPQRRAAASFEPSANTCRPKTVLLRRREVAAASAIATHTPPGARTRGVGRRHPAVDRRGVVVDGLVLGQPLGHAAADAEHAERDDEGRHPQPGHGGPVQEADQPADADRGQGRRGGAPSPLDEEGRDHARSGPPSSPRTGRSRRSR
jgi:hypothetical protein